MPEYDEDLAAELRGLASWIEVGEPADQRAAVRARLTKRSRWSKRWIVGAVAAVVAVTGAVAPARAAVVEAVGDLLRVAGIEVRREPATGGLPARPSPLPSARSARLEEARRVALFPVRVPEALGAPEKVELADPDGKGAPRVVTMAFRGGAVRFDQFDGSASMGFFKSARDAEWVQVGPDAGIWLSGPHPVTYAGRDGLEHTATARLAAPTLIWESGGLTYRLEGIPTRAEALQVALSLA
ncbi:hypothetical protein AB0M20_39800 [Actinoplanes sp. NPDC051633]|uniref:hypothetical protein n=1 Tax=Actinoplanes sp. NPDC051633 TaxID=3155670 RepID=UPI00341ACA84